MGKVRAKLSSIVEGMSNIGLSLAGVSIVLMSLIITVEVVGRTFFGFSTLIAAEMAGYLLVAVAFLGVAYTFKSDGFIKVDFVYKHFRPRLKMWVDLFDILVGLLYIGFLSLYIWRTFVQSYLSQATSIYISKTPLFIPQAVMVVGCFILLCQMTVRVCTLIGGIKQRSNPGEGEDKPM